MSHPVALQFSPIALDGLASVAGRLVLMTEGEVPTGPVAKKLDRLTRGTLARALASAEWAKCKAGDGVELAFPTGLAADVLHLIKLPRRATVAEARKAGAAVGRVLGPQGAHVLAEGHPRAGEISFGLALRAYEFSAHKSGEPRVFGPVTLAVNQPEAVAQTATPMAALAEGVFFTRDLVNEPANILTTDDFAGRLAAMQELGLEVEILEEPELKKLGMHA